MKQSKWDIILGGLLYGAPTWIMLIPILVDSVKTINHNMFILAFASMIAFLCMGMNLTRINYLEEEVDYLEEEVERLNKKLDENK